MTSENSDIIIKPVKTVPWEQLKQLYREAGWWDETWEEHPLFLDRIVGSSACFMAAIDKETVIGMGRALSDNVSDGYIQDVTVLKSYRGKGLGKKIIQALVEWLGQKGVDWIGLVAEPGTVDFYRELGFQPLKGHTALKYEI